MKNNLHRFAILIFGIFFIINPTQSQTINLNFEISEATEINAKLSGFNTDQTFNEIFEASRTWISIVDKCAILPFLLIEEDLAIDLSDYVLPSLSSGVIKMAL